MESAIRLFKSVLVEKNNKGRSKSKRLASMKETIGYGFVFSPTVIANYTTAELKRLSGIIQKQLTLTAQQMNNSFHKSWQKVRDASMEQLVLEQIIHYFTTYGFEKLGIYDKDSVYIPSEELDIPELDEEGLRLVVIQGLTEEELTDRLLELLGLGVALADDTIKDVLDVATFVELSEDQVEGVKNKEVRVALYDYLDMFPENPVEFLRYMVYKATDETLLIKNDATIEKIRSQKNLSALKLLKKYKKRCGLERLAEIFYRFKPLFLAFRSSSSLKTVINRIRKLAPANHKPMPEDFLNTVTAKIGSGDRISGPRLAKELDKVNMFRKIRLAYALKFRTKDVDSIVYRVRNGKSYATDFQFDYQEEAQRVLDLVLKSIAKNMDVKGKKIHIPEHMEYSLPATEKQFTGYFPSGSCVVLPKDMIVGIHWDNVDGHRIDLDLSLTSLSGKVGWDASYQTEGGKVLFSGDVTDACDEDGASELFYVKKQEPQAFIMMVNYYNQHEGVPVPFKILVGHQKVTRLTQNYTIDPNNVVAMASTKIDEKQKMLGLLVTDTDECRFYFVEGAVGKSITTYSDAPYITQSREYMLAYYRNSIRLDDVLVKAGAKLVDAEDADIDLSPERLEKDTILNLVKGAKDG